MVNHPTFLVPRFQITTYCDHFGRACSAHLKSLDSCSIDDTKNGVELPICADIHTPYFDSRIFPAHLILMRNCRRSYSFLTSDCDGVQNLLGLRKLGACHRWVSLSYRHVYQITIFETIMYPTVINDGNGKGTTYQ